MARLMEYAEAKQQNAAPFYTGREDLVARIRIDKDDGYNSHRLTIEEKSGETYVEYNESAHVLLRLIFDNHLLHNKPTYWFGNKYLLKQLRQFARTNSN